jgi:hypothetical protein
LSQPLLYMDYDHLMKCLNNGLAQPAGILRFTLFTLWVSQNADCADVSLYFSLTPNLV